MGFIQSSQIRTQPGQNAGALKLALNNLFAVLGPISLISADVRMLQDNANDVIFSGTIQYRTGGLATYRADLVTFDPNLGTTFDAQVATFYAGVATTQFPRMMFDLSVPTVRQLQQAILIISETVAAAGAGSYAVGDQQFLTKHAYFATAQGNILPAASGTVRLYSTSGRFRDVTATNKGAIDIPLNARVLVIWDHISQQAWAFPSCCDAP